MARIASMIFAGVDVLDGGLHAPRAKAINRPVLAYGDGQILMPVQPCTEQLKSSGCRFVMSKKQTNPDAFIQAVLDNNCEAVIQGLSEGRDPNRPDQYGWIPLHRAATNGTAEALKILLQAGSSLTATGTEGWTPLHLAAVSGSSEAVKALVEAGADVDALSLYGDTPLHLCVAPCNVTSAETLLRAGAKPDLLNKKGLSPLVKAQQEGCNSIAQLLQDWGKKG